MSCTNAGIFEVKLSGNTSHVHTIYAIEDYEEITDVLVGARLVYIQSHGFAETFSYNVEQITASSITYFTTPSMKLFLTGQSISYLEPMMDEASGRIAMAVSPSAVAILYYSQYDKYK